MKINRLEQTFRRIIKDAGGEPDGNEEFFFHTLPREGLPDDHGLTVRTICGIKRTSPALRGSMMLVSKRMFLSKMFKGLPEPTIYLYNPMSSDEVIEAFINQYGLGLDVSNFQPIAVERLPFRVKIDLKGTAYTKSDLGDYSDGRIYLNVKEANVDLGELITKNVLSTPAMPYEHRLGYTNAELLTYGVDFTPSFEEDYLELRKVSKTEDINGTEEPSVWTANTLIRLLKERLGIVVTRGLGREFELSLYGAQFIYNGPTTGYASADVRYDNVLVFKTLTDPAVDEAVYTYRGTLYLHYNNVI